MDPFLQLLLALALIIVAAKGAGYVSTRLGQPAVLGELLAGLLLGPTALNMLHWPVFSSEHLEETIHHLAHLGVLFLMFIAGLEVDLDAMRHAGRPAILAGVMGVIAPIALAVIAGLPFGYSLEEGFFIGLTLAATSVSISAQTLMELGVLRSRVGMGLLGAAVADDVLVVLLLSLATALAGGTGNVWALLWTLAKMLLFFVLAFILGKQFLPRLSAIIARLPISEGEMALAIVIGLLYAWAAEALGGVAAITGAFLAGLLFGRTMIRQVIETRMHTLAYAWLVPVFFVSIGLETNARALGLEGLPFALAIIGVAIISKIIGCGAGAWIGGFSFGEALRLGVGMVSRGEVGLIVASVTMSAGLVKPVMFATAVLMVLVTTLVTPLLLRVLYPAKGQWEPSEVPATTP
jgi:Kef-type K+ transport system membrane component KefB